MSQISTCLWFESRGEEAANFYVELIPNSKVTGVTRPDPNGEALLINFELDGVQYMIINGGSDYAQNGSASIVYRTQTQEETDRVWEALLGSTGTELPCAWLKDQFGMMWQIVPQQLIDALSSPDAGAAQRAQQAMFQMKKIDIAAIEAAFAGR